MEIRGGSNLLKALKTYYRLLSCGSIAFETSLLVDGKVERKDARFRTVLDIDGDVLNIVPDPDKLADPALEKAWVDAADRHRGLMGLELKRMREFRRRVFSLFILALVFWSLGLENLASVVRVGLELTDIHQDVMGYALSVEGILRGVSGVLVFLLRKKLLKWLLGRFIAFSRSIAWKWIKKNYKNMTSFKKDET